MPKDIETYLSFDKSNIIEILTGVEKEKQSDRFNNPVIPDPLISVTKGTVNIRLCQTKYYSYSVKRANKNEKTEI